MTIDSGQKGSESANRKAERVSKLMARAGICSRRRAEDYIRAGRVRVSGQIVTQLSQTASRDDAIAVDGRRLVFAHTAVWRFHKPAGFVTTRRDERGRQRIFDCPQLVALEAKYGGQLICVGRLDINSEGLLLVTNDGEFARFLETSDDKRVYRARVFGALSQEKLTAIETGKAVIDAVRYGRAEIVRDDGGESSKKSQNRWFSVSIREGKNREVRKLLEWCGGTVNRLVRVSFGGFVLGELPIGAVQPVPDEMLRRHAADFFQNLP